jgi:hypothetical protein
MPYCNIIQYFLAKRHRLRLVELTIHRQQDAIYLLSISLEARYRIPCLRAKKKITGAHYRGSAVVVRTRLPPWSRGWHCGTKDYRGGKSIPARSWSCRRWRSHRWATRATSTCTPMTKGSVAAPNTYKALRAMRYRARLGASVNRVLTLPGYSSFTRMNRQ